MLMILKLLFFAVLWFFAVGPALWYGVIQPLGWPAQPWRRVRDEVDDLGEHDNWRHCADMTDEEHVQALASEWKARGL